MLHVCILKGQGFPGTHLVVTCCSTGVASSAKIRRDESTTAKIRLGHLLILNVYDFGSSGIVEVLYARLL